LFWVKILGRDHSWIIRCFFVNCSSAVVFLCAWRTHRNSE
jgi:hypothetical protein